MGEQADYLIDSMIGEQWNLGGYDGERRHRAAQRVTCRRCGETDLRWGNVKGGSWMLHTTDGDIHSCIPVIERIREVRHV